MITMWVFNVRPLHTFCINLIVVSSCSKKQQILINCDCEWKGSRISPNIYYAPCDRCQCRTDCSSLLLAMRAVPHTQLHLHNAKSTFKCEICNHATDTILFTISRIHSWFDIVGTVQGHPFYSISIHSYFFCFLLSANFSSSTFFYPVLLRQSIWKIVFSLQTNCNPLHPSRFKQ